MTERIIFWGDGVHDDTPAMQALIDGKPVYDTDGLPLTLRRVWPPPEDAE